LYYNDKIGEYNTEIDGRYAHVKDNIGTAITYGFETMIDWSVNKSFFGENSNFIWNVFSNVAITDSQYLKSEEKNIEGKKVEFVPLFNLKTGTGIGYKNFMTSFQFTYISSQFTDATNQDVGENAISNGILGKIPSYYVADFSTSYKWKNWKLEAGISNFTNNNYFTRRATGYPGPGIIPSDTRTFYTTLEFVF
jgi:Fe(3+) dicitrate transport protein